MKNKLYKKEYVINTKGNLLLINPQPALEYNETMVESLLNAENAEEECNIKIKILRDFKEIYEFDLKNSDLPEPFGRFSSKREKDKFKEKKLLIKDFSLYNENIFSNYHEKLYAKNKHLLVIRCPKMIIDYNELYDRALCDYVSTLIGMTYPFKLNDQGEVVYVENASHKHEKIIEPQYVYKKCEYRGKEWYEKGQVTGILIPTKSEHAITASYILPTLIEHFLVMYLRNRMLFKGISDLEKKMNNKEIEISEEEHVLIEKFKSSNKDGVVFNSSERNVMNKAYKLFTRTGVLRSNKDNKKIFTGYNDNKRLTLGEVFYSDYAKTQIAPEYMDLLSYMFRGKHMNVRNNIMHGNNDTADYFAIGLVSVMMQILWDIARGDLFISI